MKLKIILFALIGSIALSGCSKDDLDKLRNPLVIEGDLDPVWAIPVAKWSVEVNDLMGWIDTLGLFYIYKDENDIISMRYQDSLHSVYDYSDAKGRNALTEDDDSIRLMYYINGRLDLPIFSTLQDIGIDNLQLKGLYVTASSFIDGHINDTVEFNFNHGIKLYFDSITLTVMCANGFNPVIPLSENRVVLMEEELINGKRIDIVNNYDISPLVNRQPKYIRYSANLNVAMPKTFWYTGGGEAYLKSIGFDSVTVDTRCMADFPLQIYCQNITRTDTIEWNLPIDISDSVLNEVERYLTLDSTSCIVIEARNNIPLTFLMNLSLLDTNMVSLTEDLLNGDQLILGGQLVESPILDSYVSGGYSRSCITVPIDFTLLKKLRQTRYLSYRISLSSSTIGALEEHPTVAVQGKDKIELRARVVLAPHVHFATDPIDIKQ